MNRVIIATIAMVATPSSLMAQSKTERILRDHTPDEINSAMCAASAYAWCMGNSVKDLSLRSMETPQQVVEAAERSNCLIEKSSIPEWWSAGAAQVDEQYLAQEVSSMRIAAIGWVRAAGVK